MFKKYKKISFTAIVIGIISFITINITSQASTPQQNNIQCRKLNNNYINKIRDKNNKVLNIAALTICSMYHDNNISVNTNFNNNQLNNSYTVNVTIPKKAIDKEDTEINNNTSPTNDKINNTPSDTSEDMAYQIIINKNTLTVTNIFKNHIHITITGGTVTGSLTITSTTDAKYTANKTQKNTDNNNTPNTNSKN